MNAATELLTVFAADKEAEHWVEYTVSLTHTSKADKPVKLNATLAWRSSAKIPAIAAIRGSYGSSQQALEAVQRVAEERGRKLQRMTKRQLDMLKDRFDYPAGRSSYLLEEPALQPITKLRQ